MGVDKVEMVFKLDSLNAVDVARCVVDVFRFQELQVRLYGKAMIASLALQNIAYQQRLLTMCKKDGLGLA